MLWTIFLLLNGLFVLVLIWSSRSRQKNEPPLDKGPIPWLGHALTFRKDAAKFLAKMKTKHGDIFTLRVAGKYVTVLLDPDSYDAVLYDSVCLDNSQCKNQLLKRIFSLQLPNIKPTTERRWMEQHFQGLSLSRLSISMNTNLQNLLLNDWKGCSPTEWREEGLFSFCYSLLFRAGYLTFFERRNDATAVYKEFRKFDDLLAKLARCSLKRGKTVMSTQERLWELLSSNWSSEESESNSWQQSYRQFLQEEGVDAEMQNRALLLQLWTTQCNAGPASFWLLGFLLTHPKAMEAVKSEIRGLTLQDRLSTPVFDSVLSETLRLSAAVLISREVVQDKILRMANGQEYHLRRGDRVCLFPFLSPQMDQDIHEEPQMFKYDRFLNEDKTEKKIFYKDGKRLKHYTLPWGAGGNVCVGKEFAVTAIKQFVFLVLTHLDLEMCDREAKLPPVNPSRYGFGIVQPDGDLKVRYRLKKTQHEL
uniref:Prostacyclin synthase n=1 Tax=Sphaeramia orbicularis TaxID=375764 RepID=A0A673AJP0_9TELE